MDFSSGSVGWLTVDWYAGGASSSNEPSSFLDFPKSPMMKIEVGELRCMERHVCMDSQLRRNCVLGREKSFGFQENDRFLEKLPSS